MYTRSYNKEEEGLKLPDNYGGTAFLPKSESHDEVKTVYAEPEKREIKISRPIDSADASDKDSTDNEAIKRVKSDDEKIPFLSKRLRQIFESYHLPKLDFDDLLLIAIAAFVFLSQSDDIECAIMILLLVFIK